MWGFYRPFGLRGAVGGFGGINGRFVPTPVLFQAFLQKKGITLPVARENA